MRILVAIASYGTGNDQYLAQVLKEYRSTPFEVDIVVLSNARKEVPSGIELVVGLPNENPWSLPFAHKKIFAQRLRNYDLFIYSEDDILVTERNMRAFLKLSSDLPDDEIPGFLRFEIGPDGNKNYPDFHVNFRWDPRSVRFRNEHTLAFFTNEHSGCYILTQLQLQRAIESGGFLVGPYQGVYGLPETAATDPYTRCGFKKLICISHIDDFLVHHLSNKYAGRVGLDEREFPSYVEALLRTERSGDAPAPLFDTDTKSIGRWYSKDFYEPVRKDVTALIPETARTVLSIGCGWGETEAWLARSGRRVVALPLDSVMSSWAASKGVEVVNGDLTTARQKLAGEPFDCLLISNVLHLVEHPPQLLSSFAAILSSDSSVIAIMPKLPRIKVAWKKMRNRELFEALGCFEKCGVHITSRRVVRKWFKNAGLRVEEFVDLVPKRAERIERLTLGLIRPFVASEIIAVGRKTRKSHPAVENSFCKGQIRPETLARG